MGLSTGPPLSTRARSTAMVCLVSKSLQPSGPWHHSSVVAASLPFPLLTRGIPAAKVELNWKRRAMR